MKRLIAAHSPTMKNISFVLTALTAAIICGSAHAQQASDEDNLEYQKLKVLEPLVGTYRRTGKNEETGRVWEMRVMIVWSDSKKMLIREVTGRNAAAEAELAEQEWPPSQPRAYYAWNHAANRIERIYVRPGAGTVAISEVKPESDNVFSYSLRSHTVARVGNYDFKAIVNKEGITFRMTNRTNAAGEPLDDAEWKLKKIEE